jgi:hypothetical protein
MYVVLINLQTLNHLLTIVSADLIVSTLMIYRLVARSSAKARTYAIGGKFYIIGVVLINVAQPFLFFFLE